MHYQQEAAPVFTAGPGNTVRHEFDSWMPEDIVPHKLAGFITHTQAKFKKLSKDKVRLTIGKKTWLSGGYDHPIVVTLELNRTSVAGMLRVTADMKPKNRFLSQDERQRRFRSIARELNASLMKHDLATPKSQFENAA